MPIERTDCYSIFLLPPHKEEKDFRRVIADLATKYDAPIFDPHITLISDLHGAEEALFDTLKNAAADLHAIPVSLIALESRDIWHRCLFARAELTLELQRMQETIAKAFGKEPLPDFLPHISLLYGDYPLEQKPAMAMEAGTYPHTFVANRLALYRGIGWPNEWRNVGECELKL